MAFDPEMGKQFGKPDWERLGIFVEMPYMHGVRYVAPNSRPIPVKGPTMMPTGRKTKSGNQSGYFNKEFMRLYEGEAIARKKPPPKPLKIPFLLGYKSKRHSTPGDYYGTFTKHSAFSPNLRDKPEKEMGLKRFTAKNGKKGGPGYANICINKYPEHEPDRYGEKAEYKSYGEELAGPFVSSRYPRPYFEDKPYTETEDGARGPCYIKKPAFEGESLAGPWLPIGPTKWQGGCHGGMLNPFPEGEPDRYVSSYDANKNVSKNLGEIYFPTYTVDKSMFTTSIMRRDVELRVNTAHYKNEEPTYVKYLLN